METRTAFGLLLVVVTISVGWAQNGLQLIGSTSSFDSPTASTIAAHHVCVHPGTGDTHYLADKGVYVLSKSASAGTMPTLVTNFTDGPAAPGNPKWGFCSFAKHNITNEVSMLLCMNFPSAPAIIECYLASPTAKQLSYNAAPTGNVIHQISDTQMFGITHVPNVAGQTTSTPHWGQWWIAAGLQVWRLEYDTGLSRWTHRGSLSPEPDVLFTSPAATAGSIIVVGQSNGRVASATMSASTTSLIATYSSGFTVDESVKATAPVRIGSQYGVLLGGSLGTLKVWSAVATGIQNTKLPAGSNVLSFAGDPNLAVVYAILENSGVRNITRINPTRIGSDSTFGIGETWSLPPSPLTYAAVMANKVHALASDAVIHSLTIQDCSSYACGVCGVTDPEYCGYCVDAGTCSFLPTRGGDCAAAQFTKPPTCPSLSGMSVTRGSTVGGTTVQLSAQQLYDGGSASDYECRFGGIAGTISQVSSTSIVCMSPPASASTVAVSAKYKSNTLIAMAALDFTYYDCMPLNCSTCVADSQFSECRWCYGDSTCKQLSQCASINGTVCPSLNRVEPSAAKIGGGNSITLYATPIFTGISYSCQFGAAASIPATTVVASTSQPGHITCQTVASPEGVTTAAIVVSGKEYAPSPPNNFEFYDCGSFSDCFTCLNNHPECEMCDALEQRCQFASAACPITEIADAKLCPTISTLNPSSLHVDDGGMIVNAELSLVNPGIDQCKWQLGASPPVLTSATVSGKILSCAAPPTLTANSVYTLVIMANATQVTPGFNVPVYDCAASSCQTCISSSRPKCEWCSSTMACGVTHTGCADLSSTIATCPVLTSVYPQFDSLEGGSAITLVPSRLPDASLTITCNFAGVKEVAAMLNGTNYVCVSPNGGYVHTTSVSLRANGLDFTDSLPFQYYTCASTQRCSDCRQLPGCSWCGGTRCEATATCLEQTDVCPYIDWVTPNFATASSSETVIISTTIPIPNGVVFDCIFNDNLVSPSTQRYSENSFICATPPNATLGIGSVRINTRANNARWTNDDVSFEFYSCPDVISSGCSNICAQSKYCGWCYGSATCVGNSFCLNDLWSNSTTCPTVVGLEPNHVQVASANSTLVQEMTIQLSPEFPLATLAVSKKRALDLSQWSCSFTGSTNFIYPVKALDPVANTATCDIPPIEQQGFYDFYLLYKGNRINGERMSFQSVDCNPFASLQLCGNCIFQPQCGWCPGAATCATTFNCNQTVIPVWTQSCPDLSTISPQLINVVGGVEAIVSSNYFVPSEFYNVRFNDQPPAIPATWISATQLSFLVPASAVADANTVELFIYINDTKYAQDPLQLNYITDGVNAAVLGPTISIALLIIIGLAIALIIMKKRKIGFFNEFKLKEPDYILVAFGAALLEEQYKVPKDGWDMLIQKINKEPHFVDMLVLGTASTEEDQLARTFVYVFEKYDISVPSIVRMVQSEINSTEFENTLFRSNSVASKMFKFYSKVVGIKYLFSNLARYILELEKLAARKTTESTSKKSLLSMEMEVDPERFGAAEATFMDSEANLYQLILACQKIFSTIRDSIAEIPVQWKDIFRAMKDAVYFKFQSEDAVYKGVGGFLFLRFIGPAITAPHAYGLLENPPNERAQRQLVLIGKVIQSLANMQMPGQKEVFMQSLNDFFVRNIPKMKDFYLALLAFDTFGIPKTQPVTVPEVVVNNCLGWCYGHILTNTNKLRGLLVENFNPHDAAELKQGLDDLTDKYGDKPPKKIVLEKRASRTSRSQSKSSFSSKKKERNTVGQ